MGVPAWLACIGAIVFFWVLSVLAYPIGTYIFPILSSITAGHVNLMGEYNLWFTYLDWGMVAGLFGLLFFDLYDSWQHPDKTKALVNLIALFVLGWLYSVLIFGVNLFIPWYLGETPIFFTIISSGILPYFFMIFLIFSIVFNVREAPVSMVIITQTRGNLSEGIR